MPGPPFYYMSEPTGAARVCEVSPGLIALRNQAGEGFVPLTPEGGVRGVCLDIYVLFWLTNQHMQHVYYIRDI